MFVISCRAGRNEGVTVEPPTGEAITDAPADEAVVDVPLEETPVELPTDEAVVEAPADDLPVAGAETAVVNLPLAGSITSPDAEISGMAWYGDTLILMPQFPDFERGRSVVFAIPKSDILTALDADNPEPITPLAIPFESNGLGSRMSGFEGYEAIAFVGDDAYLTIEAHEGIQMRGFVARAMMSPDLSQFAIVGNRMTTIEQPVNISNRSDEALFVVGNQLVTIYESNGSEVNDNPMAHLFDLMGQPQGTLPFPAVPFRVTDVTEVDENGRFHAINYNFPGDRREQEADTLIEPYTEGATHLQSEGVERIIELQYAPDGITLVNEPPIQLQLLDDDLRNWEGIVRLDDRGFLLVTDKFPTTLLGFVPAP